MVAGFSSSSSGTTDCRRFRRRRSHPRPSAPAVNFTPVTSPLLLGGKRLRASGDYLNGKSEMAKCTFLHTLFRAVYTSKCIYLSIFFLHPKVTKEHRFIFFFCSFQSALCSDSRPSRHTLIHLKACAQKWEPGNNKLAALMAFSLNNLALGCRFFKIYTR